MRAIVNAYQTHLQEYATLGYLDLWYTTITAEGLLETLPGNLQKPVDTMLTKARGRNHLQVLDTMTDLVDDQKHIIESPPLVVRAATLGSEETVLSEIRALVLSYFSSLGGDRRFLLSRYRIVDVARKVVGVGSVGTRCWVVYLEGKDGEDPLFLQVKEAQPSVLAPYSEARCGYRLPDQHQGRRVVIGQRLIQGAPDIFLGWGEQGGIHYYVRQLRDMKGSLKLEQGKFKPSALPEYGAVCGWALALAHAKSGDAAMLAGYVGTGDSLADGFVTFAEAYADQTERDYDALTAAARQGRIPVAEALSFSRYPAPPPTPSPHERYLRPRTHHHLPLRQARHLWPTPGHLFAQGQPRRAHPELCPRYQPARTGAVDDGYPLQQRGAD